MTQHMRNPRAGTATGAHKNVRPGGLNTVHPTGHEALLHEVEQTHTRAVTLLRKVDPVAVELYELGFRAGMGEGERRAGERAQQAAAAFLAYLAEEPAATPRPIPPLENDWRAAA